MYHATPTEENYAYLIYLRLLRIRKNSRDVKEYLRASQVSLGLLPNATFFVPSHLNGPRKDGQKPFLIWLAHQPRRKTDLGECVNANFHVTRHEKERRNFWTTTCLRHVCIDEKGPSVLFPKQPPHPLGFKDMMKVRYACSRELSTTSYDSLSSCDSLFVPSLLCGPLF